MKKTMKEKFKYAKGITIISLVIIIIVMIIIATISINMGLSSINSVQDSSIETNLEIVQQAITQQYSKAMTLENLDIESNINSNSGNATQQNQPTSFVGTPLKNNELKRYVDRIPEKPDLINVDNSYNYEDTNYEDVYYLISDTDLEELGIDVGNGQEYIVNYSTGEVLDVTNQSFTNGEPAYINGFTAVLERENEEFVDTPINIAIYEDLTKTPTGYKFTIKVTDEIAKITPQGVTPGKTPTQAEVNNDPNDLNKNDVTTKKIIITGNDPDNPIENVTIVKKVVEDPSQGIGEHYIYEITIDDTKIDPTNPSVKIEILPDSVIDDEDHSNATVELTTSIDQSKLQPIQFDFKLDNIIYYAKNADGETIPGLTLGSEKWGSSASVDLILSTSEKRGLSNESYTFDYIWSTTAPTNWTDAKQVTLNPRQGVKTIKETILLEGYTGKGKLYVKPSTNLPTTAGSASSGNRDKSIDIYLDCTPPIYKVEYKAENGTWKPLEEYLADPNGYFTMSEPISPGNVSAIEISPKLKVTTMDSDAGLPQESISGNSVSGYYTYGIHTEDDLEQISYEAEDGKIGDVGTIAHYSECFEAGWYPMEVKNGKVSEFPNELEFLASHNIKKEGSGEYILVCSKEWGYDGAYFIDCLGNKLEGNALYNNLKIDYFAPEVSKIELFEEGYGEFYITDDYSGIKLDKTKIKYAWIEDSSVPSNVQWKTITDAEIKQKQQPTKGGAYKRIGFKVEVPEVAANYYLAVKLDDLEDIAGNKINTEIVSEENIRKEVFDFTLENLTYEIQNSAGDRSDGFKVGNELWGQTATVDIVLTATGKNGLKANTTYLFEYYWTTDKNYNWNTPASELSRASIYVRGEGKESQTKTIELKGYTGAGYLYVRPAGEYQSASGTKLSRNPKSIKVNLDNTKPEINVYYTNPAGIERPIEEFIAKKDSYISFTQKTNNFLGIARPNMSYSFVDNESGLASEQRNVFWGIHIFHEEGQDPSQIEYSNNLGAYNGPCWIANSCFQDDEDAIVEGNIFKQFKLPDVQYFQDVPSGEYYFALKGKPGNVSLLSQVCIADNCGNIIEDIYSVGPIKIDSKAPEIVDITSDESGNAIIQIDDDYSGLTKDYKKIKYAWVKDKNEEPTTWSNDFLEITEENHTSTNNPRTINAKVKLNPEYADWYLVVNIEGYKDIAGNQSNSQFVSEETFCLARDLKIEVFEYDGLEKIKDVNIKITSESGKPFKIKSISCEHKGLNAKHTINIGMDKHYIHTEYIANYSSTVNGPIIVYVEDAGGNIHKQEYTVKNVQGLILNYDLSEKELWLPIWRYYKNLTTIDDQLIHVNWDKLNNNEGSQYVVQNLFNVEDVMVTIDDSEHSRRELSFNPVKDVAIHEYSDIGDKQVEITGIFENVYFNYDYQEIEQEHAGTDISNVFTKESLEDIKYFYDKMETSRNSLKEVVQFGWSMIGGVNVYEYVNDKYEGNKRFIDYKGESRKAFFNCKNLKTIPLGVKNGIDINALVFRDIKSLYFTFAGTGISGIDPELFEQATYLTDMVGTFDRCKSFTSFDVKTLSKCKNLTIFKETLRESGISSIPEDMFIENEKLENVQAAFDQTPLGEIPPGLFRKNLALQNASYTFKKTLIESIPPKLFENNTALENASFTFQHTENLTGIPEELFQTNVALKKVRATFEGATKVKSIPKLLFINNGELIDAGYTFKKTSITEIPENIFINNRKIELLDGTFSYTKIQEVSNNVVLPVKGSVVNCGYLFEFCEQLKIEKNVGLFKDFKKVEQFYGVFKDCKSLNIIPQDLFSGCSSVTNFSYAFYVTPITKLERTVIFGEDVACKDTVNNVSRMFAHCGYLKEVDNLFQDFINLNDASNLFFWDNSLKKVSQFAFEGCENIVNIGGMFYKCGELVEFGEHAFDDSMSSIKLISSKGVERNEIDKVHYIRDYWHGIFQECRKLPKNQTPPLYDHIPFRVPAGATGYNNNEEFINYNSYVNCGFDLDYIGAREHVEEWRIEYIEE